MAYAHEARDGVVPLDRLGKGPRRDPPLWARSVRLLLGHATGMMRDFYATAPPREVWKPLLIAVCRNGEVAPMLCVEDFARDAWAARMREVFREAHVVRYVQTMEAWMSLPAIDLPAGTDPRDPALDRLLDDAPPPELDPDGREVALAYARERRGRDEASLLEILRDGGGRVSGLRDAVAAIGPGATVAGALGPLARLL